VLVERYFTSTTSIPTPSAPVLDVLPLLTTSTLPRTTGNFREYPITADTAETSSWFSEGQRWLHLIPIGVVYARIDPAGNGIYVLVHVAKVIADLLG
jgi:hypothetical protein